MSASNHNLGYGGSPTYPNPMADQRSTSSNHFDVLDTLRRKFWLISFFTLLGLALAVLFFFKAPKTYRSTAKVFIDEKSAVNLNDVNSFNQNTVEKYIEILRSTTTLERAVRDGKLERLSIFDEVDSVVRYLRDGKAMSAKSADIKSNSGVIKISFDGANPQETQQVLQAVVAAFGNYIDSDAKEIGGETTKLFTKIHQDMLVRQKEVQSKISELMQNPEMIVVDGRIQNPFHLQQARLHEELYQLKRDRTKLEARIATIQAAKAEGRNLDSLAIGVLQEFSDSSASAYAQTHDKFVELKIEEQELIQEFGSRHPKLEQIRSKIEIVNEMRMQELSSLRGGTEGDQPDEQASLLDSFVQRMGDQIAMGQAQEKSLEQAILDEQKKAAETAGNIETLQTLQRERDRLELACDTMIAQLGEMRVLSDFEWRKMNILNPASAAEQVAPSLPLCLAGGLFLGALLGLAVAGAKEIAEKTFRSSEDVTALLGARVIGHVPLFHRQRPRRDSAFPNAVPELIALHQPNHPTCEAYRSIRTSIFFKAQETGGKIIQITSPTPGDGKSTTIANLAASMAQSGRKVLVIDADLRKPKQHKYFGIGNEAGLTSIVCGELTPEQAVHVIQPEYLSIVPCGPIPNNPAELLTSAKFESIIESYRDQYDFILLDTPPVLAVTDPAIVSKYVDLVYFVMRIANGVRSNSTRAKEIMDSMGVNISGVVVNGLRRRDEKAYDYRGGKYGYGNYAYGNSYTNNRRQRSQATTPIANLAAPVANSDDQPIQ